MENGFFSKKWKTNYVVVLILITIVMSIVIYYLGIPSLINVTEAGNIINVLIQSEASVIAIVVTLSLVAVQLTAQSYSVRVIGLFMKDKTFLSIVVLYIAAIISGIVILIVINVGNTQLLVKYAIFYEYWIGIVAFISLIPFIYSTLDLLKPSTIIQKLGDSVNQNDIISDLSGKEKKDPLLPIIDVILSSLKKHDLTTLNDGLDKIVAIIDPLLEEKVNQEQLLLYIFNIFRRISLISIYYNDEDSVNQLVTRISDKGERASRKKLKKGTVFAIEILGELGRISAPQFLYSTVKIAESIKNIYILDLEQKIGNVAPIGFLGTMGKLAAENKLEYVTDEIILNIDIISKEAITQKLKKPILMSLYSLRTIGKAVLEQDLDNTSNVIDSMRNIGISTSQSYPYATHMSIFTLDDLKKVAFEDENENVIVQITESMKEIIISLSKQRNEQTIINGLISLEKTGKLSNEKNLISALNSVKLALEELQTILKHDKLIEAAGLAATIKEQIENP